eukprot:TRINITY_DN3814_c0_g2_i2.p1 TRINITY_DN3814_c0_g2~~TRINITY_DN3814_c0_g2_i2.p1  ORF type:complete len:1164 (+),score=253.18 TRINITY_DN3814_c0_g2_i2:59-3550(+)
MYPLLQAKSEASITSNNVATRMKSRQDRVVRVFLSSTFRDMQHERDEFFNFGVHRVQEFAKKRAVELIFIDLRWGVTEEDSQTGKVIEQCLDSIEQSAYCVCFLGNRYGWIPDRKDEKQWSPSLDSKHPWVKEYSGKSVTEMEIQYAGLRTDSICHRVFCYERDHEKLKERMGASPDWPMYEAESQLHNEMQNHLKSQITSKFVLKPFMDPRHLTEQMVQDLIFALDRDFPEEEMKSDWEEVCHAQFARSRLTVFHGRESLINSVIDKAREDVSIDGHKPIVLTAESGIGKSSLVAAIQRKISADDWAVVFSHYVGCSNQSGLVDNIISRCVKFAERYILPRNEPGKPSSKDNESKASDLVEFVSVISNIKLDQPVIIMIDAVNQLQPSEKVKDPLSLYWIPHTLPKNVHIIVSTVNTDISSEFAARNGMSVFTVSKLTPQDIREIVVSYFLRYGKKLTPNQLDVICNSEQSGHPLFLRTLLDELRVFGVYEHLEVEIRTLLETRSPLNLYSLIISRWEGRYGVDMVESILVVLHITNAGLTEMELEQYARAITPKEMFGNWKSFFFMLLNLLFIRNGRLAIFHQLFHQAIDSRYIFDKQRRVNYFVSYSTWLRSAYPNIDNLEPQIMAEIVHSLIEAESHTDLYAFLAHPQIAETMLLGDYRYNFFQAWSLLQSKGFQAMDAYYQLARDISPAGDAIIEYFIEILQFEFVRLALIDRIQKRETEDQKHSDYCTLGRVCTNTGRQEAVEYFDKALEIRKSILGEKHPDTAFVYYHMSRLQKILRNSNLSLKFSLKALEIQLETLGEKSRETALTYSGTGAVLKDLRRYKEALEHHRKSLEIHLQLLGENHPATAFCYLNIGLVYKEMDNCEDAVKNYRLSLAIRIRIFGEQHHETAACYDYIGVAYRNNKQYQLALDNHLRALQIRELIWGEDSHHTAVIRTNLAIVYKSMNRNREALDQLLKTMQIRKSHLTFSYKENIFVVKHIADAYAALSMHEESAHYHEIFVMEKAADIGLTNPANITHYSGILKIFKKAKNDAKIMEFSMHIFRAEIESIKRKLHPTPGGKTPLFDSDEKRDSIARATEYLEAAIKHLDKDDTKKAQKQFATICLEAGSLFETIDCDKEARVYFEKVFMLLRSGQLVDVSGSEICLLYGSCLLKLAK